MTTPQGGEFARGWKLLFSATLGVGLGLSPLPFYTSGVFVAPLSHAFGWSTAQVLSALIGTTLGAAAAAPFAGYAADRLGVRRVALTSCVLYSFSWLLLTFTNGSLLLFDASWAVVGIVGTGTLPLTWTRPVSNRFIVNRGLAFGIALFATGLFGAVVKLYAGFLIGHFGWRTAYAGIGLLPLCISLPVAICFFHDIPPTEAQEVQPETTGTSLAGALADRRFWTLGVTLICSAFALGGPIPNLERMLGTHGFAPSTAVLLASFIGYGVVVGRVGGGWLLDRVWAPLVGFVLLAAPAVGLMALASTQALGFAPAAGSIFLLGMSVGSEYDLIAFMTARYFGMRSYSAIYGLLYGFFTLGSGFAPSIFGHSFDMSGTYAHVLHAAAGLTFLGALLLLTLGRYPDTAYTAS
jgi:predicted MFS family arabinose efflux permease